MTRQAPIFTRAQWSKAAGSLAVLLALTLTVGTSRATQARETRPVSEITQTVDRAIAVMGLESTAATSFEQTTTAVTATNSDVTVTVEGSNLLIAPTVGAPVSVTLPTGTSDQVRIGPNGTIILAAAASDFAVAVTAQADGGVRVLEVVDSPTGPNSFDYALQLPAGARLEPRSDGGVDVLGAAVLTPASQLSAAQAAELLPPIADVDDDQLRADAAASGDPLTAPPTLEELQALVPATVGSPILMHLPAPWAVDASGRKLPTTFVVNGATLTQQVDTRGAQVPVVAG